MFNKKQELTRTECLVLSIAQWSVLELLSTDDSGKNVFFTEISMSTSSIDKLKNNFGIHYEGKYRAYKLKANFTRLSEAFLLPGKPSVKAEMLFRDIGTKNSIGKSVGIWEISGMRVEILDYPLADYYVHYDSLSPKIMCRSKMDLYTMRMLVEREKRFVSFFKDLFYYSMGGIVNVATFDGNIVSNV